MKNPPPTIKELMHRYQVIFDNQLQMLFEIQEIENQHSITAEDRAVIDANQYFYKKNKTRLQELDEQINIELSAHYRVDQDLKKLIAA